MASSGGEMEKVLDWLNSLNLGHLQDDFKRERIDVKALLELDMKDELGIKLGDRKLILRERHVFQPQKLEPEVKQDASAPAKYQPQPGVWLSKGYLPTGPPIEPNQLHKIRKFYYNGETLAKRDVPLSDEELECWQYQAEWLCCPITGKSWHDKKSILGVGLYQEPRFLSQQELQRRVADDIIKTERNKKIRESGGGYQANRYDWHRDFQVYPTVPQPPPGTIDEALDDLADDTALGRIHVITGPVFDIQAYNWGVSGCKDPEVLSHKSRGVLSMDQQYDAMNFQYYVERAENSFERKLCTNRLSVYIDEIHGKKIFPRNIESQLSLLLYRDKTRLKKYDGSTDQKLLATAIKQAIPRILKGVILELYNGGVETLPIRTDHAIRTYLLIHQVSIRLLVHYQISYNTLYRKVVRFLHNPFDEYNLQEWQDMQEWVFHGNYYVSVMRRLLYDLCRTSPLKKAKMQLDQRLNHLFAQNTALLHCILCEQSLFTGRSVKELDRTYLRCAGSLVASERNMIKSYLQRVRKINCFEDFWSRFMGASYDLHDARLAIQSFMDFSEENIEAWKADELPAIGNMNIKAPLFGGLDDPDSPELKQLFVLEAKRSEEETHDAQMRKVHQGFPALIKMNNMRVLPYHQCSYVGCGARFRDRRLLFRHLKKYVGKSRMVKNFHVSHFKMQVRVTDQRLDCLACGQHFANLGQIHSHYKELGVRNFNDYQIADSEYGNNVVADNKKDAIENKNDPNINECAICMDASKDTVFLPCSHVVCCQECAKTLNECPACRGKIEKIIPVFHV